MAVRVRKITKIWATAWPGIYEFHNTEHNPSF